MSTAIQDGQTILFIGDSITDCGRRAAERPLGAGYVKLFSDMLIIRDPARKIHIVNKGIGGDRVPGLRQRWTDDVMRNQPDWLVVKIGINDLHSHLFQGIEDVNPAVYEECYDDILTRAATIVPGDRTLLIDPFYLSVDPVSHSRRRVILDALPAYLDVVARMSAKFGTRHLETHARFQELLAYWDSDTFCGEPVHPNPTGHLAIAEWVYAALS